MNRVLIGEKTFMLSKGERKETAPRKRVSSAILMFIILFLLLLWADAYVRTLTRSYQYKVSDVNREVQELEQRKMELHSEIARLKDPRRIEKIAVSRLGLVEPDSQRIVKER